MNSRKIYQGLLGALVLVIGIIQFQPGLVDLGVSYLAVSLTQPLVGDGQETSHVSTE